MTALAWPSRSRLLAWLVGTDPRMVARRSLCLVASVVYNCWIILLLVYAEPKGLVSSAVANFFVLYICVAQLTFYPLVRSRLTLNWADPGLVVPQMLWASGVMVLGYVLAPVVRPAAFQTLCLIQVFGFLTLRPRQTLLVGGVVMAMVGLAWLLMMTWIPQQIDLRAEALKITGTFFGLFALMMQSHYFARVREGIHREKLALAEAAARLQHITFHDALTGLCNRAHMEARLALEIERVGAGGPGFSVALVDLDHFKRINDVHGHPTGDAVLVAFAQRAREVLRETDLVARWGGEEFLILMPDTVPGDLACKAIDRLHHSLAAAPLIQSERVPLAVSFSCGMADSTPGLGLASCLERADKALYRAKHAGRKRTVLADASDLSLQSG